MDPPRFIDAHVLSTRRVGNHLEYCIEAVSRHPDYTDEQPWQVWRRYKDFAATEKTLVRSRRLQGKDDAPPMPMMPPKTLSRHASSSRIGESRTAALEAWLRARLADPFSVGEQSLLALIGFDGVQPHEKPGQADADGGTVRESDTVRDTDSEADAVAPDTSVPDVHEQAENEVAQVVEERAEGDGTSPVSPFQPPVEPAPASVAAVAMTTTTDNALTLTLAETEIAKGTLVAVHEVAANHEDTEEPRHAVGGRSSYDRCVVAEAVAMPVVAPEPVVAQPLDCLLIVTQLLPCLWLPGAD